VNAKRVFFLNVKQTERKDFIHFQLVNLQRIFASDLGCNERKNVILCKSFFFSGEGLHFTVLKRLLSETYPD
jgi:hypothetical protein